MREDTYKVSEGDLLKSLKTNKNGLSDAEAKLRLLKNGLNKIESGNKKSRLSIFLSNFKSPLIYLLIVAGLIALFLGNDIDALIIFIVVIINAVIGYFQESKAEDALEKLEKMAALKSVVIRNGEKKKILAEEIVPGDILVVSDGMKVPADARIIESVGIQVDESLLTGESVYINKSSAPLKKLKDGPYSKNLLFKGTTVVNGHGLAVVYATGKDTEFGKIGEIVANELYSKTPLQIKLEKFGKQLGMAIVLISAVVYILGTLAGHSSLLMFETAVSLAVSAIPEGLPVAITVILVLGMRRMAKKKAIIRNLAAVETLGTTTVIASDKTGTLTHNRLSVVEIFVNDKKYEISGGHSSKGEFLEGGIIIKPNEDIVNLIEAAVLASSGDIKKKGERLDFFGDPIDVAITITALKAKIEKNKLLSRYQLITEIPFNSARKFMASQYKIGDSKEIFIKGAFEEIIKIADRYCGKKLTAKKKKELLGIAAEMAKRGLRVVAVAKKKASNTRLRLSDVRSNFDILGFIGMRDTYRIGAKHAISVCKRAGIKVMMLTGDHLSTARTIGHDLGILKKANEAVDATKLSSYRKSQIVDLIEQTKVFARISPKSKYDIVEALKSKGEIVAMTGDGVNDVPALVKADIGIAMGVSGADAAKEAADMILTDDNFATIVNAVEEGRTIFENIRKTIFYLFSTNIGEVFTVLGGIILGLPLVLTPVQILWLNLVTDTPTVIPLGMEPSEEDHLAKPPRDPKEHILSPLIIRRTILVGIVMMVIGLWIFNRFFSYDEGYARTMIFNFLVVSQWLNAFNAKSEIRSIFKINIFDNMWLVWGTVISIILQSVIMYVEPIRNVFNITTLNIVEWGYLFLLSLLVILVAEIDKLFVRWYLKSNSR